MIDRSISTLPHRIEELDSREHMLWERIYTVSQQEGKLILPEILRMHGEYSHFIKQRIIRITNRITHESTLFNELRARRPFDARFNESLLQELKAVNKCPFCHPLEQTPSDLFGRVEGRYCLTASNLTKYDALHALLIFREHEPFVTDEERIRDFLETARVWFIKARQYDPHAHNPFFMWNCLWRAGASIIHGHAQLLLAAEPYRYVREWLQTSDTYQSKYGSSYEGDIFSIHQALGLGRSYQEGGILAHLTPTKEKEMMIIAPDIENLPPLVSRVLSTYYRLGVRSFNLAILQPSLDVSGPVVVRVVDRGDLLSRSSDIGGMELYGGMAVVSSDPFILIDALAEGG